MRHHHRVHAHDLPLEDLLDNLYDGVYFVDRNRTITYWNRAAERLTGFTASEVVEKSCAHTFLCHTDDHGRGFCAQGCPLQAVIEGGGRREAMVFLRHKDGHRVPVRVRATPLRDARGDVVGAIEVFSGHSNAAELAERNTQLLRLGMLDPFTQIPNDRYLNRELALRLRELQEVESPFGVLLLTVNDLPDIVAKHGQAVAGRLLHIVAQTLVLVARSTEVVGRWSETQFLAIVPYATPSKLPSIADRFLGLVAASGIEVGGARLGASMTAGGTVAVEQDSVPSLLDRAHFPLSGGSTPPSSASG